MDAVAQKELYERITAVGDGCDDLLWDDLIEVLRRSRTESGRAVVDRWLRDRGRHGAES